MRVGPAAWIVAAAFALPTPACAQTLPEGNPGPETRDLFSEKNRKLLCNSDDRVRSAVLMGELGRIWNVNLIGLPDVPSKFEADGQPSIDPATVAKAFEYSDDARKKAVYWIAASNTLTQQVVKAYGLEGAVVGLIDIKTELVKYVAWLETAEGRRQPYAVAPNTNVGDLAEMKPRKALIAALLDPPVRPGGQPTAGLICVPPAKPADNTETVPTTALPPSRNIFALRGAIDDLATPRNGRSAQFKATSDAKLAYTRNGVDDKDTMAVDAVVGYGRTLGSNDALMGFVRYYESSSETKIAGDDDDTADIRALSAGLLYRRPFDPGVVYSNLGITAYKTWDRVHDAQLLRMRVFMADFAISADSFEFCGREYAAGPLHSSCRMGLFVEKGRVLDAGRDPDFTDRIDDDYVGVGWDVGLSAWLPSVNPVANFMLNGTYKRMVVVDGDLDSPDRFTLELAYKIPDSDVSVALSRTLGQNFDTFEDEELNMVSIGFKY